MRGRNLFRERQRLSESAKGSQLPVTRCVFISYRSTDKDLAVAADETLTKSLVDIYVDEDDELLKQAKEVNDYLGIASCIEDGLDRCTHLLGLLTSNTRDSWWVPYEIGGAKGRGRALAYLVDRKVLKTQKEFRKGLEDSAKKACGPKCFDNSTKRKTPPFSTRFSRRHSSQIPRQNPKNRE